MASWRGRRTLAVSPGHQPAETAEEHADVDQSRRCRLWLASCLGLAAVGAVVAGPPRGEESVERLKADVYYLASDTLEGRGISTPGIDLAAQHIRAEFRRLGLKSGTP